MQRALARERESSRSFRSCEHLQQKVEAPIVLINFDGRGRGYSSINPILAAAIGRELAPSAPACTVAVDGHPGLRRSTFRVSDQIRPMRSRTTRTIRMMPMTPMPLLDCLPVRNSSWKGLGMTPLVDVIAFESFDYFEILLQQFGKAGFVPIDHVVIELQFVLHD